MRKLVATLACRNQGSRLYGKPFQNLDIDRGLSILDNLVACLSKVECIQAIVLAIACGNHNKSFIDYANTNSLPYVIGDEIDVLSRLILGGDKMGATDILRITTESPFPYIESIQNSWLIHCDSKSDALFLDQIIDGCGFEIVNLQALKDSHAKGTEKHRSELCTLYIRQHPNDYKIEVLLPPEQLIRKDLRLTVDYPEDLIVCRQVYKQFADRRPDIPLLDAVRYLDDRPDLKRLIEPYCDQGYESMYL